MLHSSPMSWVTPVLRAVGLDWKSRGRRANRRTFRDLIACTNNFATMRWLGHPIWQNVLDLWTIQETLAEVRPALLIEGGTHRGGSALFYAHLFDLMNHGRVITIDIERIHDLKHPRIEAVTASALDVVLIERLRREASRAQGAVMVILDDNHTAAHVRQEMEMYAPMVTPGSFLIVQDGLIDTLPGFGNPPGPLVAIREFLQTHAEFEVDRAKSERFPFTHHPSGWLRRHS